MTVITGPGFYTSKAGKCEVVAVKGEYAIGWDWSGHGAVWNKETGQNKWMSAAYDIVGVFVDKPKSIEAWAIVNDVEKQRYLYWNKQDAEDAFGGETDRLVHLIEAEDR